MKLSDAIMLGDSLKKPSAYEFLSLDHSCGCALGGARLATGELSGSCTTVDAIRMHWPWITEEQIDFISWRYCQVANGRLTIEELCDYVRTIEPAEPEYEPEEEYWSDADTTREMINSIKGR